METENLDPTKVELWQTRAKFQNVVLGNIQTMKDAHDALLAFGRSCNGTDQAIIQLRNSIEYSQKALEG